MSLATFQSLLVRLITEPAYRDAVRGGGGMDDDLTDLERRRLHAIARDPGMDVNRTLHKGFRLGKVRALLPLTCRLLGPRRLTRELAAFWDSTPPAGFSFLPEALAFCDFLAARKPRVKYLHDVLGYERATLELERARQDAPAPQRLRFAHDPQALLSTLAAGRRPRGIAARACMAIGTRAADGRIAWQLGPETKAQPPGW